MAWIRWTSAVESCCGGGIDDDDSDMLEVVVWVVVVVVVVQDEKDVGGSFISSDWGQYSVTAFSSSINDHHNNVTTPD